MLRNIFLVFVAITTTSLAGEVAEITEQNWRSTAPRGKEADWIYGDYVLRNDKIVAVVAKPVQTRNANMTVRNVAGAIIDLTFRYRQADQLSCFYPGAQSIPIRYLDWSIDGDTASITVGSDFREDKPAMDVTYELKDGDAHLTVTSVFSNPHDDKIQFFIRDSIRADTGFTHDLNASHYVCSDFWWRQAYGIVPQEHEIEAVADSLKKGRPIFSYKGDGGSKISLAPGETYTLKRYLIPGEHALDVMATAQELENQSLTPLSIIVRDALGFVPHAQVTISQDGQPIGKALTGEAGPLGLRLPAGEYDVEVQGQGRGTASARVTLDGQRVISKFELPKPGYVVASVTDDQGSEIPAKVQFRGNGVDDPDFGPNTKSFGVQNVQYTANGKFKAELSPGTYDVIISRGNEYDASFQSIEVIAGETTRLTASLRRSVETPGWISTEYHSHSTPSGDNTSDQLGRVLNLLAEHIEFAPCTEHNRISSYSPHLEFLKAEHLMATCTGMELTGGPLPVNHQNAFPLYHHPHTQDGGAPTTLPNPIAQIERLAMWDDGSDKLVQENHPNLEQIWADQDLNGEEDEGFRKMFGFMDVVEVHPPKDLFAPRGDKSSGYRNVIQPWLRMLNHGIRIPCVVNTDAHYNFHGSGWLRNYVKSSTDDPAQISTMEMVHESEHGHIVVTNGPYLEVTASSGDATALAGDDLLAEDGKVSLRVKVQCPNWFDINRVQLFINGRASEQHNFTRRTSGNAFGNGTVKFEQTIEVTLEEDAHLIVGTIGEDLKLGPVMGPAHEDDLPVAFQNPIFVDIDGNGFTPNKDLLDLSFPHKPE